MLKDIMKKIDYLKRYKIEKGMKQKQKSMISEMKTF